MSDAAMKISDVKTPAFVESAIRDYGTEVLEDRAIPVDLDGLKPSQRRLLYALSDLGSKPNGNHMKCALIIGEAMGKYHPHGDAALYDTLVNMVKARYPLVDGHGNFGSVMGDPPAAHRYTGARISKLGADMTAELAVMPMIDNYSNDFKEPVIMPAPVPLLLCNGSQGIAVGVACNIPPHNLAEIIDATIRLVKKPKTKMKRLLKYVKGPDYANGGILTSNEKELLTLYTDGKGRLTFRCDYNFEDAKDHKMLVITSLAPYFNVGTFFKDCQKLQGDNAIEYVNDESDHKHGVRIVVGFKNPQALNDILLPKLSTSVNYDFYALQQDWMGENKGKKSFAHYSLIDLLQSFIQQRRHIEKLLLEKEQAEVLSAIELAEARLIATDKIDQVVRIMKDKKNTDRAMIVQRLIKDVGFNERQANYICDLKVIQIAAFSADEQHKTIGELRKRLKEIKAALKDLDNVVINRLKQMKARYKDDRKTAVGVNGNGAKLRMKVKHKFVMLAADGGYRSFDEVPARKGDYPKRQAAMPDTVQIAKGGEVATVVRDDGWAQQMPVGYTKDGFVMAAGKASSGKFIGIVTEQSPILVAISENAEICPIENPQKSSDYMVGKFSTPLKAVLGIDPKAGDKLLLISKNSAFWCHGKDLPVRRKNTVGKHMGGLRTCVHALVVKDGQFLYDEHGAPFEPMKKGKADEAFDMKSPKRIFIVGKGENLVLYKDGTPAILSKQETVVALRNKELTRTWPAEE